MKSWISITFLMLFYVPFQSCLADDAISIEVGGGKTFLGLDEGVLNNWHDGWMISPVITYEIRPTIELCGIFSFHHFYFDGNNLEFAVPELEGLRVKTDGQSTNIYETSIGFRFIASPNSKVQPFISVRSGLYFMDIGKVNVTYLLNSQPYSEFEYHGTGTTVTKMFSAVGIGVSVPVNSYLQISVEGQFTMTFDGIDILLPIAATAKIVI